MTIRNNPRKGIREPTSQPPRYFFSRPPTTDDKKDPLTDKFYEVGSFAIIGKNPINGIPVASGTEGDLYYLSKFDTNGDAIWVQFGTGGGGGVQDLRDQVDAEVGPSLQGLIDIDGDVVLNGDNPSGIPFESVADAGNDTMLLQIQLTTTGDPGSADINDVGLIQLNENQFQVDPNTGLASLITSTDQPPVTNPNLGTENLGLVYTIGTGELKITSASGAALSSTNKAYVTLNSNADPGLPVRVEVTADQSFIDNAGASEIIGNLFGKTTTNNWGANDIPFYIYAVLSDSDASIAFMISRNPSLSMSPVEAKIGAPDDPVADLQSSFFSFENLNEALYAENSCLLVGSFRMRTAVNDDWIVQALAENDGIGYFQEEQSFNMPQAIFGASSSTHLIANGGTAPVFTTSNYKYSIQKNGRVTLQIFLDGDAGTDGAGSVDARLTIPFIPSLVHHAGVLMAETPSTYIGCASLTVSGQNYVTLQQMTDGTTIQNGQFSNGDRQISGQINYFILNDST